MCEDGHIFCDSHAQNTIMSEDDFYELSFEEKKKVILNLQPDYKDDLDKMNEEDPDAEDNLYDWFNDLESEVRYECSKSMCPCCNLTAPTDCDIVRYLAWDAGKTKDQAIKEMQEKFGTLEKMDEVLGEN
jgi:hypothetical protein